MMTIQPTYNLHLCMSKALQRLCGNPYYYPMSPIIMQAQVINTSSKEEEIINLTKAIEGQTKFVQNQNALVDKLMDRIEDLIDKDSSHAPGKALKVHETEYSAKQTPPIKEVLVSLEGMIPFE